MYEEVGRRLPSNDAFIKLDLTQLPPGMCLMYVRMCVHVELEGGVAVERRIYQAGFDSAYVWMYACMFVCLIPPHYDTDICDEYRICAFKFRNTRTDHAG